MKRKEEDIGGEQGHHSKEDLKDVFETLRSIDSELGGDGSTGDTDPNLTEKLRDVERRHSIVQALLNVSTSITSTLNLEEVLRKVVDSVVEITDTDRGFLMLAEGGNSLDFAIARSRDKSDLSEKEFRVSETIVKVVAESGEPKYLPNVQNLNGFKDQRSVQDLNIHTAICMPLKYQENLVGVIYADSDRISGNFSESDLSLMEAFGAQAAVAIENARAHGEVMLNNRSLENQNTTLRKQLAGRYEFSGMVGHSMAMRSIFEVVKKVAPLSTTVLIWGDTGTGKELIARAIHHNSPRRGHPMQTVNCGAVPKELLESELFGHKKGAFTGADQDRMGLFEAADGGTVFLDEIGEMGLDLQVKLLRVLQSNEVTRIGENKPRQFDARVISATNKDLKQEVDRQQFRKDLYYRLNVVPIYIPPLRDRPEDILPLAEFFLERYALSMGVNKPLLSREVKELLMGHRWDGNVRELEHAIERALALCEGKRFLEPDLFAHLESDINGMEHVSESVSLKSAVAEMEKGVIRKALMRNGWNVSQTAHELKISRQQLHIKIKKYQLNHHD